MTAATTPQIPDVTVIVIGYNDAARLPTAVRSVLRQTLRNLEVVIVDDGSTDQTPEVVATFCAADARVRSVRLSTNSGSCGAPRNAGIEAARAANIMFLDSDDRYERHACKNLLEAREDADADFAMGLVRRYHTEKRVHTPWYQPLFDERRVVHGIAEDTELIRDTLSVNKLFRRAFLDEIDLRFPVDLHYEDQLFTIQAYHRALRIAVIPEHVYTWRVFTSGDHGDSITNQRHQVANARSRLAVNRRIDDYLDGHGATELLHLKRNKFLEHDMRLYLQESIRRDPSLVVEVLAEAEPYLRSIPTEYFLVLPHALRAAYGMALRGDMAGVRQAMLLDRMNVVGGRFVRHDGHVYFARGEPIGTGGETSPIDPAFGPEAPENLFLQADGMPLLTAPFGTFHLHSEVTGTSTRTGALHLTGTTTDTLGKLDGRRDWRIQLVARRARHRALVRLPVTINRHEGGQLEWNVDLRAGSALSRRVTRARWELSVETRIGDRSIRSPLLWPVHLSPDRAPVALLTRLAIGATASIGPDPAGAGVLEVRSSPGPLRRWVPGAIQSVRDRRARLARAVSRHQKRLRETVVYPALRRVPLNPRLAVFESNLGSIYGDSPKYVYRAMRRLRPDLECVWVLPAGRRRPDTDVEVVQRGTLGYLRALSRATYWIDNQTFPWYVRKRAGQRYLQTWHGTPLKRMGRHIDSFREEDIRSDRGIGAWDHLCISSPYFERTLADAFAFTGDGIRWGTPRNDPLVDGSISRAKARAVLDLPESSRVVLYAPTFREQNRSRKEPVTIPFDVTAVLDGLGADTYLLLRPHYLNRVYVPPAARHRAIDVGDVQDVNLLYLAADVLVTDYSSVMFDFALTGRPIVFFTHDYDDYSRTRGTYFDLRDEAPGTLTTDTEGLVAALQAANTDRVRFDATYRRFVERYCGHEDGHAAERAARRLLGFPDEAVR